MLTRREFLLGIGAAGLSAILPLNWGCRKTSSQNPPPTTPPPVEEPFIPDCDWILDKVTIIDGTGKPRFQGKIAVKDEHITAVGDFAAPAGCRIIDGGGLVAAPGFIDIHTHTENYVYSGESMAPFLSQGITAQIGGNCGRSPRDIAGFFQTVPHLTINYGLLVGYRTLREMAGVNSSRKASKTQIKLMQEKLAQGLEAGGLGLSVGLEYPPQHLATTEELILLCEVVKEHGGFYATHIRSEYDQVLAAVEEAVEIGMRTGVPVQYCHIKAGYERNWPKFPQVLKMLEEAKAAGLDITADVYPYTFSSTDLGLKPFRHSISEENLAAALTHSQVFIGSDTGIYAGGRANHPRAYGNCPRVLGLMVREKKLLSLEEAVAKMTSWPAQRLKLSDRGRIQEGCKADIVLFDPDTVKDKATMEYPSIFSEGIRQVWVNGALAWSEGKVLANTKGQVLTYS